MMTIACRHEDGTTTTHAFNDDEIVIGREQGCDLVIQHRTLSRRHVRVLAADGAVFVEDLGSQNGVQNIATGARITGPARIEIGSGFRAGAHLFFVQHARANQAVAPLDVKTVQIVVYERGVAAVAAPYLTIHPSTDMTIGRDAGANIVLPRANVSPRHCRLVLRDDKFIIIDLKSTNGTFVNGRRITSPVVLKSRDLVSVGDFLIRFAFSEELSHMSMPVAPILPPPVVIPDDATRISAPVERVTLYEDRAEVTRTATVALSRASSTLVFDDVTSLASESLSFVRVEVLEGDGVVHVDDVRIARSRVTEGDETLARGRELSEKASEAARVVDERNENLTTLQERVRATRELLNRFAQHTSTTAGQATLDPAWRSRFDDVSCELARCIGLANEARQLLAEATLEHARLAGLAQAQQGLTTRARADVIVRLSGTAARARVTVSSVVPCALWRPSHDATLSTSTKGVEVQFTTLATVWQKTGEAWNDVELTFSTARPNAGAKLPKLLPDVLTTREKTTEEKRTVIVEHRQEVIPRHEGEGVAPGVDDGGETRTYRGSTRASIPSDGRPHQVAVAHFSAPARTERIAVPEMSPLVFLRASLVNSGQGPILAGPVTLKENGAYVGVGDVLYVGQGENFDLSFGSDDRFRVRHEQRRVVEEKLIGKDGVIFVSETTLVSMSDAAERVVVLTRFPVSEVDKLTVSPSLPHCTDGAPKLDAHGLARMVVELQPLSEKKISLGFQWKTSGDVRIPDPW